MDTSYLEITQELSQVLSEFRRGAPDVAKGFSALAQGAMKEGVVSKKTKELIALALGVAKGCDGCIGFHAKALVDLAATREEVLETLGVAVYMGGGPSLMYAAMGLKAFEEFASQRKTG